MKYLLDTCTFLWIIADQTKLSSRVHQIVNAPDRMLYFSAVSAWEIAAKYSLSKLALSQPPDLLIRKQRRAFRIRPLSLHEPMAGREPTLPKLHKDPFDRMLICQALVKNYVILTPDHLIRQYPVQTDW